MTLTVPKLRSLPFETAIIERYRRRESSVEEALIEMYLAGVSVRRVEDITQALWGTRVSASTVSDLNQKIYKQIDEWRQQPLVGDFPYVFVARTADARDPTTNQSRRRLPRWQLGAHVGRRKAPPRGRNSMGNQTLSPDEPAGRSPGPFEGGQSKSTPTQQPSKVTTQIESARQSGRYHYSAGVLSYCKLALTANISFHVLANANKVREK